MIHGLDVGPYHPLDHPEIHHEGAFGVHISLHGHPDPVVVPVERFALVP